MRVYVVGVGSSVSRNDLTKFASSNSDVLHLPSLRDPGMARRLIDTLCEGKLMFVQLLLLLMLTRSNIMSLIFAEFSDFLCKN